MDEQKAAKINGKNHGAVFDVAALPKPFLGVPPNSLRLARMVFALQEDFGLEPTGVIDKESLEAMAGKLKKKPSKPMKSKKKEQKGKRQGQNSQGAASD